MLKSKQNDVLLEPIRESRLTLAPPPCGDRMRGQTTRSKTIFGSRRNAVPGRRRTPRHADRETEPAMPPRGRATASRRAASLRCDGATTFRAPSRCKEQGALADRLGEEAARTPLERGCPQMLLWKCRRKIDGNPGLDTDQRRCSSTPLSPGMRTSVTRQERIRKLPRLQELFGRAKRRSRHSRANP